MERFRDHKSQSDGVTEGSRGESRSDRKLSGNAGSTREVVRGREVPAGGERRDQTSRHSDQGADTDVTEALQGLGARAQKAFANRPEAREVLKHPEAVRALQGLGARAQEAFAQDLEALTYLKENPAVAESLQGLSARAQEAFAS